MITVRKASQVDATFIAQHAHRLLDFKLPEWRKDEREDMVKADIHHITKALRTDDADDCVFIAEDETAKPIGFLRVVMQTDYYTGEQHAHVNDIVVITEAQGKGAGKLLLEKADEWAEDRQARWITLNVFNENFRARSVYEKAGYEIEWIKYLKHLKKIRIFTSQFH
ncbi:MAG: GNAT family N-acetyltransferase [Ginsengibacter sp.]